MKKLLILLLCVPLIGISQNMGNEDISKNDKIIEIEKPSVPFKKENQTFIDWYNSSEYKAFVNQASIWINQSQDEYEARDMAMRLEYMSDIYMILKDEQYLINELNKLTSKSVKRKYDKHELPIILMDAIKLYKVWEGFDILSESPRVPNRVLEALKEENLCNHTDCKSFQTDNYDPFEETRSLVLEPNYIAFNTDNPLQPTKLSYGVQVYNSKSIPELSTTEIAGVRTITNEDNVLFPTLNFSEPVINLVKMSEDQNIFKQFVQSTLLNFKKNNQFHFKLSDGSNIKAIIFYSKIDNRPKEWIVDYYATMHISVYDLIKFVKHDIVGTRLLDSDGKTLKTWIYPEKKATSLLWTHSQLMRSKNHLSCLLNRIGHIYPMRWSDETIKDFNNRRDKDNIINDIDIRSIDTYSLNGMIEIFLADCKANQIKINDDQSIQATFETLDGITLGLSYKINNDKKIKIVIDPILWKNASIQKKWYILYHELGHDVLNLEHGQGGKMMFNFAEREYTWFEFFEDKKNMFLYYKNK